MDQPLKTRSRVESPSPRNRPQRETYSLSKSRLAAQRVMFAFFVFVIPIGGSLLALTSLPFLGISWLDFFIFAAFYGVTAIGTEIGFHRCFAHRSFLPSRLLKYVLAVSGCMSLQGTVTYWVAHHRCHHGFADQKGDPHSPHTSEDQFRNRRSRRFWHSHFGWIFSKDRVSPGKYARDLLCDQQIIFVDKHYRIWAAASILLPPLIAYAFTQDRLAVVRGVLWGGCFRIFLVQQLTFGVNSFGHMWGSRSFETSDQSRNIVALSAITCGGFLHNNHHAFPWAANAGCRWYEFDTGMVFVWLFERLGLATNVKWNTRLERSEQE